VFASARWRMAALDDCLPAVGAPTADNVPTADGAAGIVVALHGAADPGNLGTILRTSDWFGSRALLLSAGSVDPGNPKTVRASMGSLFRVATGEYADLPALIRLAHERGYAVTITGVRPVGGRYGSSIGLDDALHSSLPARMLLLLGSEAHGLPDEVRALADFSLHIARRGGAESLNLATAHGILLFALLQTRRGLLICSESPSRFADA
jgi:TrmH family RNA methyltransferase